VNVPSKENHHQRLGIIRRSRIRVREFSLQWFLTFSRLVNDLVVNSILPFYSQERERERERERKKEKERERERKSFVVVVQLVTERNWTN